MHKQSLSLQMSQIIAADAPLLSPTDPSWFSPTENYSYAYYNLPPSPPLSDEPPSPAPAHRMLKAPAAHELCVPTHQLFDFADARPPTPPSRSPSLAARPSSDDDDSLSTSHHHQVHHAMDDHSSACGMKRSASPAPSACKKRAVGERISSKDFIPPDVSGLSKREARLVKNRAAAFLSRQRKREEFELMEVRVAELEQENARLLTLSGSGPQSSSSSGDQQLRSEVDQLRAQLVASKERERTLSAQLAASSSTPTAPADPAIKLEASEPPTLSSFSSSSSSSSSRSKSSASLGLMVLLCALPSLLAMRSSSSSSSSSAAPPPTAFTVPNPFPPSPFDYAAYLPAEYDWAKSSPDMDDLHHPTTSAASATPSRVRRLEFADADEMGLGELDVEFETRGEDGKVRVRIHQQQLQRQHQESELEWQMGDDPFLGVQEFSAAPPSSSASSSSLSSASSMASLSSSPSSSSSSSFEYHSAPVYSSTGMHLSAPSSSSKYHTTQSGVMVQGNTNAQGMEFDDAGVFIGFRDGMDMDLGMDLGFNSFAGLSGSHFTATGATGQSDSGNGATLSSGMKKRVRIAMRSMPSEAGEGGEWEVVVV